VARAVRTTTSPCQCPACIVWGADVDVGDAPVAREGRGRRGDRPGAQSYGCPVDEHAATLQNGASLSPTITGFRNGFRPLSPVRELGKLFGDGDDVFLSARRNEYLVWIDLVVIRLMHIVVLGHHHSVRREQLGIQSPAHLLDRLERGGSWSGISGIGTRTGFPGISPSAASCRTAAKRAADATGNFC
jgi:hypothetical protein